jgi:hypothetical protein
MFICPLKMVVFRSYFKSTESSDFVKYITFNDLCIVETYKAGEVRGMQVVSGQTPLLRRKLKWAAPL